MNDYEDTQSLITGTAREYLLPQLLFGKAVNYRLTELNLMGAGSTFADDS
jgi:hypothetical protein